MLTPRLGFAGVTLGLVSKELYSYGCDAPQQFETTLALLVSSALFFNVTKKLSPQGRKYCYVTGTLMSIAIGGLGAVLFRERFSTQLFVSAAALSIAAQTFCNETEHARMRPAVQSYQRMNQEFQQEIQEMQQMNQEFHQNAQTAQGRYQALQQENQGFRLIVRAVVQQNAQAAGQQENQGFQLIVQEAVLVIDQAVQQDGPAIPQEFLPPPPPVEEQAQNGNHNPSEG